MKAGLGLMHFADVVRLADDVRGEVGMSRAIELARGGASKQAVADAQAYRSRRLRPLSLSTVANRLDYASGLACIAPISGYMRNFDFVHFTLR